MVGKYEEAKEQYRGLGIDTEQVLEDMQNLTISMHCWQGDDLGGFDHDGPLSGGIQATGNYIGKPRNVEELMKDLDLAFSLVPGKKKLNLHSSYAVFEAGQWVDRDKLRPEHFRKWVEYAKERSLCQNCTVFCGGTGRTMCTEHLDSGWFQRCSGKQVRTKKKIQ